MTRILTLDEKNLTINYSKTIPNIECPLGIPY
jgi:hypothetical protein